MAVKTICSAPDQKLSHLPPGRYKVTEDDKSYTVPHSSLNKVFLYQHLALRCLLFLVNISIQLPLQYQESQVHWRAHLMVCSLSQPNVSSESRHMDVQGGTSPHS